MAKGLRTTLTTPRFLSVYAMVAACVVASLGANALSLNLLGGGSTDSGLVSVGYSGSPDLLTRTIALLSGTVVARDDALQILVVQTNSIGGLIHSLTGLLGVRYAEPDENVAIPGVGASASRWTETSPLASRWTSTDASASRWTGTDETASRWTSTGWDASRWTGNSSDGSTSSFAGVDPGMPYQWGLGAINAPGAWRTSVGTMDRTICILDSGVDYTHPDLAGHMWTSPSGTHGYNFVARTNDPMDDAGHGTHVAGIAAAISGNGIGVTGLAQERIMAVKVLNSTGVGKESDAAFGLRWCADHGANVASLSLGTDKDKLALRDGVAYAQLHNMLVVAAAGNDGCACARYPAAYPGVLAVASYGTSGQHSTFSNTGSWIALSAPGEFIVSTYAGGRYAMGAGTSMATPFVSGAAALVWGEDTGLTALKIRTILTSTARDQGAAGFDKQFGYGSVDVHRAMDAVQRP